MVGEMQLAMGSQSCCLLLAHTLNVEHTIFCLILFAIYWNACIYTYMHVHKYIYIYSNLKTDTPTFIHIHTMPKIFTPYCIF